MSSEAQRPRTDEDLLLTDDVLARWCAHGQRVLLPGGDDPSRARDALAGVPAVRLTLETGVERLVSRGVVDEAWLDFARRERALTPSASADADLRAWLVALACDPVGVQTAEALFTEFEARFARWRGAPAPSHPVYRWKVVAHDAAYLTYMRRPLDLALSSVARDAIVALYGGEAVYRVERRCASAYPKIQAASAAASAAHSFLRTARWRRRGQVPAIVLEELYALLAEQRYFSLGAALGARVAKNAAGLTVDTAIAALPDVFEPLLEIWRLGYVPAIVESRTMLVAVER